jgi:RimJ/RimL family protein N-acetyltransferase
VIGEVVGDAEVVRFLGGQIALPEEHEAIIERWLQRWDEHGMGPFIVERREDGRFVGRTGILVWDTHGAWTHEGTPDPAYAQPEIGWAFARAAWGHGYATEAARAVIEWTRERGVKSLVSVIAPANVRSQRVAERLGATPAETVQLEESGDAVVWRYADA